MSVRLGLFSAGPLVSTLDMPLYFPARFRLYFKAASKALFHSSLLGVYTCLPLSPFCDWGFRV